MARNREIPLRSLRVRSSPITTGMVSRPRSRSLWISMRSDRDDRTKTIEKTNRAATAMSAEISIGEPTYGTTAMTRAQAAAMNRFFVPGRSRSRRKRHPFGKTRRLYRAPTREIRASMR